MEHPKTEHLRRQVRAIKASSSAEAAVAPENSGPSYRSNRRLLARLKNTEIKDYGLSVLEYLPTFRGQNLIDILDERTSVATPDAPVRVLDIGSGNSQALLDIEDRYGDKVRTAGLTAIEFPNSVPIAGKITVGDVGRINSLFGEGGIDVAFSCRTLGYPERFMTNLYPKIYKVLAKHGVALLDSLSERDTALAAVKQLDKLKAWLASKGYDFDFKATDDWESFWALDMFPGHFPSSAKEKRANKLIIEGVAFQKTKDSLYLPVRYTESGIEFDPKKAKAS